MNKQVLLLLGLVSSVPGAYAFTDDDAIPAAVTTAASASPKVEFAPMTPSDAFAAT